MKKLDENTIRYCMNVVADCGVTPSLEYGENTCCPLGACLLTIEDVMDPLWPSPREAEELLGLDASWAASFMSGYDDEGWNVENANDFGYKFDQEAFDLGCKFRDLVSSGEFE